MLVASKYEEIWAPEVKDFVFISDEAYTREQILEMEKIMLNTLRFNLTVPTAFAFLHRYLKAGIVPRHPQVCCPAQPLLLCDRSAAMPSTTSSSPTELHSQGELHPSGPRWLHLAAQHAGI